MSKVLMIIDMQKGFVKNQFFSNLVQKINKLISLKIYDYYVFTKFVNGKNNLFINKLNWKNLLTEQSQKICVKIPKNNIVFEKYGYGLNEEQIEKLKNILFPNSQIDLCGIETDACVYAIALQLFDNNLFPNILINYTYSSIDNEIIKLILLHQFGKIDERD